MLSDAENGSQSFGEVQFYFRLCTKADPDVYQTVALVLLYSPPSLELFEESHHTLISCTLLGDVGLKVILVQSIISVVAMVPHSPFGEEDSQRYFVVEKPGLDVANLGGVVEDMPDE